jgi:hypothetical protein
VIELWAQKLGFSIVEFIDAGRAVPSSNALGQTAALLAKG